MELYDLRGDLGEARDLAADRPALVNTLREKLHAWREEVNARMPQPNPSWGETLVR